MSTWYEKEAADMRISVQEKRNKVAEVEGKKEYVSELVRKYNGIWWANWIEMMEGGDEDQKKLAMIEYNKLQTRVLPTQLEAGAGDFVVKIANYGGDINISKNETKKEEENKKVIDIGEVRSQENLKEKQDEQGDRDTV